MEFGFRFRVRTYRLRVDKVKIEFQTRRAKKQRDEEGNGFFFVKPNGEQRNPNTENEIRRKRDSELPSPSIEPRKHWKSFVDRRERERDRQRESNVFEIENEIEMRRNLGRI